MRHRDAAFLRAWMPFTSTQLSSRRRKRPVTPRGTQMSESLLCSSVSVEQARRKAYRLWEENQSCLDQNEEETNRIQEH